MFFIRHIYFNWYIKTNVEAKAAKNQCGKVKLPFVKQGNHGNDNQSVGSLNMPTRRKNNQPHKEQGKKKVQVVIQATSQNQSVTAIQPGSQPVYCRNC
jgi:hypothetical protein